MAEKDWPPPQMQQEDLGDQQWRKMPRAYHLSEYMFGKFCRDASVNLSDARTIRYQILAYNVDEDFRIRALLDAFVQFQLYASHFKPE